MKIESIQVAAILACGCRMVGSLPITEVTPPQLAYSMALALERAAREHAEHAPPTITISISAPSEIKQP